MATSALEWRSNSQTDDVRSDWRWGGLRGAEGGYGDRKLVCIYLGGKDLVSI